MKKKETVYLVAGALGLYFLTRGGTVPPPPPPLSCPTGYQSDGSKCVPMTPAQTKFWSFIVDTGNADTNSFRAVTSLRISSGFTGAVTIHLHVTNTNTHEEAAHMTWPQDYTNAAGGYRNHTFFVTGMTSATPYNVFAYATNGTATERYTGVVYKRVNTK